MADYETPRAAGGHFARMNALRDFGWLSILSKNELAVLMVYESFAGFDGIAFPDGEQILKGLGHSRDNHVSRIRRSLVNHGLLEIIEPGGGRGNPCKVKVVIGNPKNPPKKDGRKTRWETPPKYTDKPPQSTPINPPKVSQ